MKQTSRETRHLYITLLCLAGFAIVCAAGLATVWLAEQPAKEELRAEKPGHNVQNVSEQNAPKVSEQNAPEVSEQNAPEVSEQNAPEVSEQNAPDVAEQKVQQVPEQNVQEVPDRQNPASSQDEIETFNPKDFKLSDLVKDVQTGNHFKIPAKARPFLREVLDSGADVQFKTTNRGGTKAYISSDLSPNIWINLAYPPERLGEAICHEMLHFEDMQRFKPITRINRTGLAADQTKVFQPVIRDLVNMISHEYVKQQLEQFGYEKPMSDNADSRMKNMTSGLAALEKNFVSVSQQLAKTPGKKGSLGMAGLQAVYQNLLLMTLRDQLLFDGAYASDIDEMIVRFQAILDFIHQSTSEDPRFKKVYLKVKEPADAIRTSCKKYQDSDGSTAERYALLTDTLNHIYEHVGISFALILKPGEPPLLTADSTFFKPGESFLLDGQFNFSDVSPFTPGSAPAKSLQLNNRTYRNWDLGLPQESLAQVSVFSVSLWFMSSHRPRASLPHARTGRNTAAQRRTKVVV